MDETTKSMTGPEVTMDMILSVFSTLSDKKKLKEIKSAVAALFVSDENSLFDNQTESIEKQVEDLIKADIKTGDESFLTYTKDRKYKRRPKRQDPQDPNPQYRDFTGKAGECAVMSELLFNGYNVNMMMVDGGVDLVAFKDGLYYFYQVKTVTIKQGNITANIPLDTFDKNRTSSAFMRYVIVARYKDKDQRDKNHFFFFTHEDLDREMHNRCIKRGVQNISVKIRFHDRSGAPILYDEKESDATWYLNKIK